MYDAQYLAKQCGVSIDTVYRVRRQLDLDRLPTPDEINQRNKKRGIAFKHRCPSIETSTFDNNSNINYNGGKKWKLKLLRRK